MNGRVMGGEYQPCCAECNGCPECDPGLRLPSGCDCGNCDTPDPITPERVTLTEGERYALWSAGDHHPEVCDCAGEDWSADGDWCSGMEDTFEAVERILSDRLREAKADALMEPWGPFDMGGFEGCTDRNPDHCACATEQQPTCEVCDRAIESGEKAWARQWPCYNTLPLTHPDQDWDVISWHDKCPPNPYRETP